MSQGLKFTILPGYHGKTQPPEGVYGVPSGMYRADISAIPDMGWVLFYWVVDGSSVPDPPTIPGKWITPNPVQVIIGNRSHAVGPVFGHELNVSHTQGGAVYFLWPPFDGNLHWEAEGKHIFPHNSMITLQAESVDGIHNFDHWEIDGQIIPKALNPVTGYLTKNESVRAVFSLISPVVSLESTNHLLVCPTCGSENVAIAPGVFWDWLRLQRYTLYACNNCGYSWREYPWFSLWVPIIGTGVLVGGYLLLKKR